MAVKLRSPIRGSTSTCVRIRVVPARWPSRGAPAALIHIVFVKARLRCDLRDRLLQRALLRVAAIENTGLVQMDVVSTNPASRVGPPTSSAGASVAICPISTMVRRDAISNVAEHVRGCGHCADKIERMIYRDLATERPPRGRGRRLRAPDHGPRPAPCHRARCFRFQHITPVKPR